MAFETSLYSTSPTMAECPSTSSKRIRLSFLQDSFTVKPNWSELLPELLHLILLKLSLVQITRCMAACSSWRSIAESYSLPQTPWLLLPAGNEQHHVDIRCFFSLEDNKAYQIKNIDKLFGDDAWCIGSFHGWLVLLDDDAKPFLLNPSSQVRIQLPAI
ncbi:hypothetical protein MANES_10G088310v8 [Manihot esculenta]|uniref:Uncharacterized protein n=1 Tax=Manihot esculenta TaxID=3983 RepID=A0ACB7H188_MANES|nr:hypothetical protein MANES_10G088310v8 [Manihot esculenta]